jgi:hypothetical protein
MYFPCQILTMQPDPSRDGFSIFDFSIAEYHINANFQCSFDNHDPCRGLGASAATIFTEGGRRELSNLEEEMI